jgi:hypothetical protein
MTALHLASLASLPARRQPGVQPAIQVAAAPSLFLAKESTTMNRAHPFFAFLISLLMLTMTACAPTPTREGTGEYIADSVITAKVKSALVADPDLKATEINVETFKGTVQLSGFVSSPGNVAKASTLARGVKGVSSVKNDLLVK